MEEKLEQKIELTLGTPEEEKVEEVKEEVPMAEEPKFTDEELKMIDEFAKKIDINETSTILTYGSAAQQKIADFSDVTLKNVRTKDLDDIGSDLSSLVTELKGFDIDQSEKGLKKLFKKTVNKATALKANYDKAEVNVEKVAKQLENHQITLLKDIALLDQLYDKNLLNYKELSMYIIAGKKRLEEIKTKELPELEAVAAKTALAEDAQKVNDLQNAIVRFEKKLYDLELTRNIAIQMAPQIRLVQNNDTVMTEKIQSTLVNTIPVWKSQMIIALGLTHSKQAADAEKAVNDYTNKMLKANADKLKQASVQIAEESERGIIDLETLQYTNKQLIETLDEVARIQTEGREKRAAAEVELRRIESELNQKLSTIKK